MTYPTLSLVGLLVLVAAAPARGDGAGAAAAAKVDVVVNAKEQRADVSVDGQPFTAYTWAPALKRPLLYPIRAASGAFVTRGWPLAPRPNEATDHPHHIGQWLSYGDVDGKDYWSNSVKRDPADKSEKLGTIVHRSVKAARSGKGQGVLEVTADWVRPDGKVALAEETAFAFSGGADRRVIDRSTTLRASAGPVSFPDNKEGMFGLRLARELEHPGEKNPEGTGSYRSSEGIEGKAVWGTRGRWMMLSAQLEKKPITIVVLDHPGNPGHPTYWHARPWGLFSANPLGQKALSGGKETLGFALPAKGKEARLRYRTLIVSRAMTPAEVEQEYKSFVTPARP